MLNIFNDNDRSRKKWQVPFVQNFANDGLCI
jgi:hypothetical protein